MTDENTPLNNETPEEASPAPAEDLSPSKAAPPPPRPTYTRKQRVMALLGAIIVIIITLMYAYSIATGDLFRR